MFLFVHVGELEFVFLFSMYCIRDYAFICPRRFIFDLFGQVGAPRFMFLLVHVGALEFLFLCVQVGALECMFSICPCSMEFMFFLSRLVHWVVCFCSSTSAPGSLCFSLSR